MNLQGAPTFSPDDYPNDSPELLQRLTETFDELYSVLASLPSPGLRSGTFMSAASGVTTVSVKNPLGTKPQHVTVALRRDDLADFSAAWSWWHVLAGDQIQVKFIGLPASTRHAYSIEII